METPSENEIDKLFELFDAGHFAALEQQARLLVARHPESGRAWKILGTALGVQGKDALAVLQKAVLLLPCDHNVHNNLGNVYKDLEQLDAAAACYYRAIDLHVKFPEAHNNLGTVLKHLGKLEQARESYLKAIELNPGYADAHYNLGNVLLDMGDIAAAKAAYQHALRFNPQLTEAHLNLVTLLQKQGLLMEALEHCTLGLEIAPENVELLHAQGNVLHEVGRFAEALNAYRQTITLKPDYMPAYNSLGNSLQQLGQPADAIKAYGQALEIDPNFAEVYNNLGNALLEVGQSEEAISAFERAIAIKPEFAGAHCNLGNALVKRGLRTQALASYQRALELDPEFPEAHSNLGTIQMDLGLGDQALQSFRRALALDASYMSAHSNFLFTQCYTTGHSVESCVAAARSYGHAATKQAGNPYKTWRCAPQPQRLRIGIVSGDLNNHPVGFALESLMAQLDPRRLELFAYPTTHKTDELTARMQLHFAAWHPLYGKSDADAARQIHADGIHILLDLSGHTAHNRLPVFAWKPAPIQASWLGYFATTGLAEMDYLLTSEVAVPEAQWAHFTESVCYLPDIWLCFTPPEPELPITPLPALKNGYVTFGCYQRLDKISDAALNSWRRILVALPNSRLRLASKQLGDTVIKTQFTQRLQQHGIDTERVLLQGATNTRAEYLARYAEVDVMLDSHPYPGVTTTCEALWMGVPTITLAGKTLMSRQGAGVLVPAGLSDWVAHNEDEYVTKAIQYSRDLAQLAAMRKNLRLQVLASPVFDAPRFAHNFETVLWRLWQSRQ